MPRIIKANDLYFELNGWKLEPVEAPESDENVYDASETYKKMDAASLKEAYEIYETKNGGYEEATKGLDGVSVSGYSEAMAAREAAKIEKAVALHGYSVKNEIAKALGSEEETPQVEAPKAEEAEEETGSDADPAAEDAEGGTPENEGETPVDETPITEGLNEEQRQLVTAAANLMERVPSASQVAARTPGQAPTASSPVTASAQLTLTNGYTDYDAGSKVGVDQLDAVIAAGNEQFFGKSSNRQHASAQRRTLGRFEIYGETPKLLTAKEGGTVTASALPNFRRNQPSHKIARTASGEVCGVDERREIPTKDDLSGDLKNLVEIYPTSRCKLEYYQDISMSSMALGVNAWTDAEKNANIAARDAYNTALTAGIAADIQTTYAAYLATQKRCMDATCLDPEPAIVMEAIYACLSWSIEQEQCNPEHIRRQREVLAKLFLRAQNAHLLQSVQRFCTNLLVDVNDPTHGFINADGVPLDGALVVEQIVTELTGLATMAERITAGNYTLILPAGLMRALQIGDRKTCDKLKEEIKSFTGVSNVIETLDTPAVTGDLFPTGPYPAIPPAGGAVGDATVWPTLRLPRSWNILVLDTDDFFGITRPSVELGAQITHDSVKDNWVEAMFLESFMGIGKDGASPAFSVDVANLAYNGARVGCINPAGLI